MVGSNTGEMVGMPPTGRTIDVPGIGMLRFKDGRAIERCGVHDTMAMVSSSGYSGDRGTLTGQVGRRDGAALPTSRSTVPGPTGRCYRPRNVARGPLPGTARRTTVHRC